MSYSKIFSGDLPELIYNIIKYFHNDYSTLYSCVLVNRLWCRIMIPILWENPFSIPIKNYNVIDIYLHYLNDDLKTKLNEYKINKLFPSTTLFNYPMFLKYLNIYKIISSVEKWSETFKTSQFSGEFFLIKDFKKFINMSLFIIFIENEVNLHTLEIEISITYFNTYVDYILEIILQYPIFIHKFRNLKIYILINDKYIQIKNHQQFLQLIINYCKNIKFLDLYKFVWNENYFLVLNLIESFNQNLNHLSITIEDYQDRSNNIKCSSIILQNLGQILPSKLEYLVLYIRENDFEIFLKNSQNTSIKKLLIMQKDNDDIIYYIKNFIMKEKRVKYLAIWNSKYEGLPYFENEVKKFELYNIKLKYYYDLIFNLLNFEKELD
ncbi:hypothetical protein RhiirA1_475917 [Rhizophagus irregularis]|uniref:F-box domain-containing protein n=1 Tax=Rhizophagus irregularis TaxID=588596 RepID=A0A2N0QW44_9GLOM|nr:hypothetical protein RhiirA1_475917 [Rhizophagus irregularis]